MFFQKIIEKKNTKISHNNTEICMGYVSSIYLFIFFLLLLIQRLCVCMSVYLWLVQVGSLSFTEGHHKQEHDGLHGQRESSPKLKPKRLDWNDRP